MTNIWSVSQPVALQIVLWIAIEPPMLVLKVSVLMKLDPSNTKSIILACPCHTDCLTGCNGCENPICYCNVSG